MITNNRDYRLEYEYLKLLQEWVKSVDDPDKKELLENVIINEKRTIRTYAHKDPHLVDVGMGFICEQRIVKDEGIDGYIELVSIPDVIDTLEDTDDRMGAETFFHDFFYQGDCIPSMYDCTGQSFTHWYKLFKRNGQFWAYHSVGFDV